MKDYKHEWMQKARIDYFAPFISLWLACNSWYRAHYSELGSQDREFINKLKTDFTRRNHLYDRFSEALLGDDEKRRISFRTNLELLYFSLNRADLQPERLKHKCSFDKMLLDYSQKEDTSAYVSIMIEPRLDKRNGKVKKEDEEKVIQLDSKYIVNNTELVFAGLFELIYQVRNMVVHGHIKPEKDEHDVVKYCYLILSELMSL